ncbi:hypothetical protein SAMD00019534_122550, partial [Acytostelium subglobosum LB1]|uniref:hypothetical protein n=1 Tax=Acytostelium subglobosum LB1 TaxID=1410327 RepID=UPI0006448BA5
IPNQPNNNNIIMSAPSKCEECAKSVYPLEALTAVGKSWHKHCYKCAECKQVLTLKTAQPHQATGKIYCNTHIPKMVATQVADSVAIKNATSAPKVALVNNQKRGDDMEAPIQTADTMQLNNARNAPKVERLPPHLREDQHVKPIATLDMAHTNALNRPKLATVNNQVYGVDAPIGGIDVTLQNAIKAPKVGTVNEQLRGTGDAPSQVASLTTQNALNAPKVGAFNEQIRGTGDAPSQVPSVVTQNAINAPKVASYNEQIRYAPANTSVGDLTVSVAEVELAD